MTLKDIIFKPIGTIYTPFGESDTIPRQGRFANNNKGRAVVNHEFLKGLKDLDSFTHAILIFYFHQKKESLQLLQYPKGRSIPRGVFAIRSPLRPNKIGMTIVPILSIENNTILFAGPDMIDGTPLLDIKPYIPGIDCFPEAGKGWINKEVK